MRIGTWNISSGINTIEYQDKLFDKSPEVSTNDTCLQDIAKVIVSQNLDIVALQEVITTPSFQFMEKLSEMTGLKYFETFEISPGFLVENTRFGVAVLSKYPLKVEKKQLFRNPNLIKKTDKGSYMSHDKGYLAVKVLVDGEEISIISTQLLPFHRFNSDIRDFKDDFVEIQDYVIENNAILCGDLNAIKGKMHLVEVFDKLTKTHNFTFDLVTTSDGKRSDNIVLPKYIKVKGSYMEDKITPSNHFLCLIEI